MHVALAGRQLDVWRHMGSLMVDLALLTWFANALFGSF